MTCFARNTMASMMHTEPTARYDPARKSWWTMNNQKPSKTTTKTIKEQRGWDCWRFCRRSSLWCWKLCSSSLQKRPQGNDSRRWASNFKQKVRGCDKRVEGMAPKKRTFFPPWDRCQCARKAFCQKASGSTKRVVNCFAKFWIDKINNWFYNMSWRKVLP